MKLRKDIDVLNDVLTILIENNVMEELAEIKDEKLQVIKVVSLLHKKKLLKKIIKKLTNKDKVGIVECGRVIGFYTKLIIKGFNEFSEEMNRED